MTDSYLDDLALSMRIYQTADQSVPSSDTVEVAMDMDDSDHVGGEALSADPASSNAITIEKPSFYHAEGIVTFDSPGADTPVIRYAAVDGTDEREKRTTTPADNDHPVDPSRYIRVTDVPVDVLLKFDRSLDQARTHSGTRKWWI
ncbi:hypothetical protein [Halorubrum sp. GN11GM_10-3_MGM]|uniref:hypothetical protein n=1 Tax=Halorubrum sp. GN11GM_10-3_MGM TaxID=2518111 RepID=UPI0010F976E6|nr:hypothetical protein [Halorubrum sp. GN11GM_10-3_MGM]TKX69194.1 hypothetical protein EXE40_11185 [Halorubrum sp. GN11GM_10-3_MGM]